LAAGIRVIMCVGESLEINEAGNTTAFVSNQVRAGLVDVGPLDNVVIAYEPIWAIGTGRAATPEGAGQVIGTIRSIVRELAADAAADDLRILYGGSVTPDNFPAFVQHPEIDGGLVGGASLNADSFLRIVRQAAETSPTF
jgi:triosephosphate isomerase (TIM)